MIVGDFSQAMYSYREDMQFAISNVAVTKDETGNIISTFDENKTVMKSWWRIGFIIPNPISKYNEINANRFPFAIIAANPELITYTVTFTVTSDGTKPIEGAKIIMGDMNPKITNSSGVATFQSPANEKYNYIVLIDNKIAKKVTVNVESAGANVNLTIN